MNVGKKKGTYSPGIKASTNKPDCRKWLVFISGMTVLIVNVGFLLSIGVFLLGIMATFGVTRAQAVSVQSASFAVYQGFGILNGAIISHFGPRKSGICGSLLVSFGVAISCIAPSVNMMYFSISLCFGLGSSLTYISASTAQSLYFEGKKNAIPLAIFSTGSSIGNLGWSYLLVQIIEMFGFRGALLLSGGITLNCIPAVLFVTLPKQTIVEKGKENKDEKHADGISISFISVNENGNELRNNQMPRSGSERNKNTDDDPEKKIAKTGNTVEITDTINIYKNDTSVVNESIDEGRSQNESGRKTLHVFRKMKSVLINKSFMAFNIANAIIMPCIETFIFIVFDVFADKGFDETDASVAMIVFSASGIVARASFRFLLQIPIVKILSLPMLAAAFGLIGMASLIFVQSYGLLMLVSAVTGFAFGLLISSWVVTTLKLVGKEHLPNAMGILMTTTGIATTATGPITGHIRDQTGSYTAALQAAAASLVVAIIILVFAQWLRTKSIRKTRLPETTLHVS